MSIKDKTANWIISPRELLRTAVDWEFITVEESRTKEMYYAAETIAERVADRYQSSGSGFGSSDTTVAVQDMMEHAGFKMKFVGGKLTVVSPPRNKLTASGTLKGQIIRLAHKKPHLRPYLLPLIK